MSPIYLRHGDQFVAMIERLYETEDVLQALLAEHPEVLAGGDEAGEHQGWLLVRREAGVADSKDSSSRWSLDHLFLDALGVPTLVEVKRSTDTRSRREVVAQMLDYAANATAFWKVDLLQEWFETECERQGVDGAAALERAFGVSDPDAYWANVQTNLAADRIRLVFVADEIPAELRSIVELLNRQMSETEVLAIEVKQYVDANAQHQTIVPHVVGRTEEARAAKGAIGRSRSLEFDFRTAPAAFHELVEKMDRLAAELKLNVRSTPTGRNYQPAVLEPGAKYTSGIGVSGRSARGVEFNLGVFRELGAEEVADELLERLCQVTGLRLDARLWPSVACETLTRNWDNSRARVIEPYFAARERLPKQR
jgi:hypothetical protein